MDVPETFAGQRSRRPGGEPVTPTGRRATVVFVVLDTVRADHLSLCGYHRPTSPTLESLRDLGASFSCEAYAPGSWTLPSHASFFTGRRVDEHAADFSPGSEVEILRLPLRPLSGDLPVLAEQFAAAGYQTVALSANPVVAPSSGLLRGFEKVRSARRHLELTADRLDLALRELLRELDPSRPLFLFVNIFDAHDPYPPIPPEVGWVPQRQAYLALDPKDPDNIWPRFMAGAMSREERQAQLRRLTDGYDYAVHQADQSLQRILTALRNSRWLQPGIRLVVVGDHGEFLGEHDLLQHGGYVWEPNIRVPLLFWNGEDRSPSLPTPISALHAYHLARFGGLPDELLLPHSISYPHPRWREWFGGDLASKTSVTVISGKEKLVWVNGQTSLFDLRTDPMESRPLPLPTLHPLRDNLMQLAEGAGSAVDKQTGELDPELVERLRALGYLGQ